LKSPGARKAILKGIGKPDPHDCHHPFPLQSFSTVSLTLSLISEATLLIEERLRLIDVHQFCNVFEKKFQNDIVSDPALFNKLLIVEALVPVAVAIF
jgi:transcriptional antiterminator